MNSEDLMRKFFEGDKFAIEAGIEIIEVNEDRAVVRAYIGPKHLNANGCVQGGMLYTIADFAFAVLGNFRHPITVTQCGSISYVAAAYTGVVTATATETVRRGHNTVSDVVVADADGNTVCVCRFNGFVKDTDRDEVFAKLTEK